MRVIGMILAGGQGTRLGAITNNLAKPAVPFGGKYRMIDFTLSNCVNSNINTVGVVTQYMPHRLVEHLGIGKPWDLDIKGGGLHILPPYLSRSGTSWYRGTADAVYQNMEFIERYKPDFIVLLSGDHIYKMDYNDIIDYHIEKEADCTIACMEVPISESHRFGIMVTDPFNRIVEFQEKPKDPKGTLASLGIYVFNWKFLKESLIKDAKDSKSEHDFGKNVIPNVLQEKAKLFAFNYEGYWRDVGTIQSYLDCNLEILAPLPPLDLHDENWKIYTQSEELPPAFIAKDAEVTRSFISEGSEVYGNVESSVVFQGVTVSEGAIIKDSVIMNNVFIDKNVYIEKAIICENAFIGKSVKIGIGEFAESKVDKKIYDSEITVVGFNSKVKERIKIGKNCVIDNNVDLNNYDVKELKSGEAIIVE
ncbi:glucose-1-phosphate adenylyltransferase [Petrotoga sp. 9PWA.NaAc.5.4]|uniref:glucose-1-phosphate adenylyltransferase n=1 Tax=Petrotoga sp. 9PWA.NaAc.5.4 TaxID=1434328 RepID=UPI000CCB715A|nr:glucose-1-phosphate adenylyltransferase [Petrotoga sp. 9PWA.NaAc.5.4]PNR92425.1 glucose-1-phosphate adenylyltransferase [Petrotoga sp. 9PWA.NaAc.5.4]